jgi:preprotein translocase subunit SecD
MVCGENQMKLTWRIWVLILVLVISIISIFGLPPTFLNKGILITSVTQDSLEFEQGLKQGQTILFIDGNSINSLEDYANSLKNFPSLQKQKLVIETNQGEFILFTNSSPQINVIEIPKTNLKLGLDLSGGSRALVQAKDKQLSSSEIQDLVDVISNRLNVYGIADMKVAPISDLSGNNYVLIEIAGATPDDLEQLVSQQGKFEAKIGNETVFIGGKDQGISSVSRSGTSSGIYECGQQVNGYYCTFRFTIFLTDKAATNQADITSRLEINESSCKSTKDEDCYLEKTLDLYLDDKLVDSLFISGGLKGRAEPQIAISGSGFGEDEDTAYTSAEENMKKLQTVLITGSLPYQLEIVKLDTISPTLGKEFIQIILLAGLSALLAISIVIFVRYRNFKSSLALILTSISEVLIVLGIASFISWNLDLPAIAGIIAGVGTGIDSQIIVLDESKQETNLSLKERLKRAFKIILGSYLTSLVALIPLMWAGAGLLKGFAITTIIGISVGVLITRPAFIDIIKIIGE